MGCHQPKDSPGRGSECASKEPWQLLHSIRNLSGDVSAADAVSSAAWPLGPVTRLPMGVNRKHGRWDNGQGWLDRSKGAWPLWTDSLAGQMASIWEGASQQERVEEVTIDSCDQKRWLRGQACPAHQLCSHWRGPATDRS